MVSTVVSPLDESCCSVVWVVSVVVESVFLPMADSTWPLVSCEESVVEPSVTVVVVVVVSALSPDVVDASELSPLEVVVFPDVIVVSVVEPLVVDSPLLVDSWLVDSPLLVDSWLVDSPLVVDSWLDDSPLVVVCVVSPLVTELSPDVWPVAPSPDCCWPCCDDSEVVTVVVVVDVVCPC